MTSSVGRILTELAVPPQLRTTPPPPAPPRSSPSLNIADLEAKVLARLEKRVHFIDYAFQTVAQPFLLRPQELRYYLFIQNTGAAGNLILSYSGVPDAAGAAGQVIGPGGFYEPEWVPDNAINVTGSGVGVAGYIIVATQLA